MSTSVATATGQTALRHDPTVRFRRGVGALALPLGILCQAVSNLGYALLTMHGGSDATGQSSLELYAANPSAWRLVVVVSMLGSMLIVAGVPAALRVLRPTRPRLSLAGGILMTAGYLAYFGVVTIIILQIALATHQLDAGAAIDASQADPAALPVFGLFVIGNLLGTFLLALAVVLSRQVTWVAGALIMAWPILHVTGLIVGTEWFAVTGGVLETIGLGMVAVVALKTPDAEWAARG
jgi:hypothetical protein